MNVNDLTDDQFSRLPLVTEGESKIVRDAADGLCVIKYKPTIYSFTANRAGVVEGSDTLRMKATKVFVDVLREAGIKHAYQVVGDRYVLSSLIKSPPPIEVVVKCFHSGTSKHRYYGMAGRSVRQSHPHSSGYTIADDQAYPQPIVRFDWRNPMHDAHGARLADEVLGDSQADWFINTKAARLTALRVHKAMQDFLATRSIVLYDLCLFIDEDGETVFGELSQDCGRFRHYDLGSLDKDAWRAGGSSERVLEKWQLLLDLIS